MTDRERLIEIIEQARAEAVSTIGSMNNGFAVWYADKLIEAEVAPVVHSKWEICCDGYYPYCKNCGEEPKSGKMTKFCPNCGANMDGGNYETD